MGSVAKEKNLSKSLKPYFGKKDATKHINFVYKKLFMVFLELLKRKNRQIFNFLMIC